ncbi:hypothetical protein MiHa_04527 [Microcystis aeruginosa NIES-2522]|nr:hypothetical protein MiHa_04527 [Microcystis aeruginosa NIES-2522]
MAFFLKAIFFVPTNVPTLFPLQPRQEQMKPIHSKGYKNVPTVPTLESKLF